MRPIIGVTPDFNAGDRKDMGGREPTYFLRARYLQAIEQAGALPIMLPLVMSKAQHRQLLTHVDGLLLTGSGADLDPQLYGEPQRYAFRIMSPARAHLEIGITVLAHRAGIPLLGICGGMQSINVAFGGTLIQDLARDVGTRLRHQPPGSATKTVHKITVTPHSLLRRVLGRAEISVNSSHHQSVKDVPSSLTVSATAPDGVIEAIEAPTHPFLLGVQWHPEFLYDRDPVHRRLFTALVNAARRFARLRHQTSRD